MDSGDGLQFPHEFSDAKLLDLALTHRSASEDCNDRLEWLGDSVLNQALSLLLYEKFPGESSGALSLARSKLTSNRTLSEVGAELGVAAAIRTNAKAGGLRTNPSVLADTVEALFGAAFLDGGHAAVLAAIRAVFASRIDALDIRGDLRDAKTKLNELLQAKGLPTAEYLLETEEAEGRVISCRVGGETVSRGAGPNRASAEQEAARLALDALADG